MTAKTLKANGKVVHRSTHRGLTREEIDSPLEQKARQEFDEAIEQKLGPSSQPSDFDYDVDIETPTHEFYEDDDGEGIGHAPDADEVTSEVLDNYIGAEVTLPVGGAMMSGKVKRRKRSVDGQLKGTANSNPTLDTRTHEVEFPDGQIAEYGANTIAENMCGQCDVHGNQFILLDQIVDHRRKESAVSEADKYVYVNGRKQLRKTTIGWDLCILWKDGSTSWQRLADVKESNPVELAEYAVTKGIDKEPAFEWWVPHTLKKRDRLIAAVNKRYHKRTHKFGVRVPKTVEEAKRIDADNGNMLWQDAMHKEIDAVSVAFDLTPEGEKPPPTHQPIDCHLAFDVKMEDFRRKARLVAGGHTTETPATLTYASVVSRETVRIALFMAALHDLEVRQVIFRMPI